jgi:hypothetical protein
MAVLRQVTFHFPHDTQIRYLERVPSRGEHVRALDGELFVVLETQPNGPGEVATCVTPAEYARATRSGARSVNRLARGIRAGSDSNGRARVRRG